MRGQTRTAGCVEQWARARNHNRPRRRSAGVPLWRAVEALERRTLLSTVTWDGGGADNNWTNPVNWLGDIAPVAGDDLVFGNVGAARKATNTNNFAAGFVFGSIQFSDTGYTLAGNAIELNGGFLAGGGDGVDNATGTNIVGLAVKLGDSQVWTNGGTTLTFNGAIDTNGQTLTIDGAGATTLAGAVSGVGSLVKNGAGTATLSTATHNYAGATTVSGGTLRVTTGNVTATAFTVGNTATLDIGNVVLTRNITLQSGATLRGSGGTAARSNGVLTLPATGTVTLATAASGDILQIGDGTNDLTGGGAGLTITVAGAGRVQLNNDSNLNAGVKWLVTAGLLGVNGGDLRLGAAPAAAVSDYLVLNGGGLFTLSGNSFALDANRGIRVGPASGTGSATFNMDNSTLTVNGVVANNGTSVTSLAKTGSGRLVLGAAGGNTFGGAGAAVNVSAGVVQIANDNQLGNAANEVNLNNGAIAFSANITTARSVEVVAGTGTIEVGTAGTTANLQPIAGAAGTTLQKNGNGTLSVTGANPLPASTSLTLTAGTLDLGSQSDSINNLFLRGGELRTTGTLTHTTRDIRGGVLRAKLAGGPATFTKTSSTPLVVTEPAALAGYALDVQGGYVTLGAIGQANSATQGLTGLTIVQGAVVVAAGGSIGAGSVSISDGGVLLADAGDGNTATFGATTVNVNDGAIRVHSGTFDLGAGSQVAVVPDAGVQPVNNALQARLAENRTLYAFHTPAGIAAALGTKPVDLASLTGALSFANDTAFGTLFANRNLDVGQNFTAMFTGYFTPKVSGVHSFQTTANDDRAAIWVDTTGAPGGGPNGLFEAGDTLLDDSVNGGTATVTANLTAGTRYRVAFLVEDGSGGSALTVQFNEPTGGTILVPTTVQPGIAAQANLWSFDRQTGGGSIDVAPGAKLLAGSVTGAPSVNLNNLGLQERVYRAVFSNSAAFNDVSVGGGTGNALSPTLNSQSILGRTPSAVYASPGAIDFVYPVGATTGGANVLQDRSLQSLSLGSNTDQFAVAFVGKIHVGLGGAVPAGVVSFGLASDDVSSLFIDLDGDGFEASERVVAGVSGGAVGNVTLAAGDYPFAIAWQESTGNERLTAKFRAGSVVASYASFTAAETIDPTAAAQAGTWLMPGTGAGTLELASTGPTTSALGAVRLSGLAPQGAVVVGADNTVTVTDLVLAADGTLTRSGAGTLEVGTQTYAAGSTFAVTEGTTRLTGAGSGAGAVAVTGAGTVLLVDDDLSSAVSVGAGATLGGNGTVSGAATVAAGGIVAPGGSTGRLTLAARAMTGAGLAVELGGTTAGAAVSGYDQLVVTGPVDLTGMALTVSLTGGFTPTGGQAFVIVRNDGAGPVTGRFTGLTTSGQITTLNGQLYRIHYDYDAGDGSVGDGNDVALIAYTDVTARLGTVRGGYRLNRATNRFQQQITFTNTSGAAISGKLTLVFKNLPPGVSLFGATTTVDGYPAIELSIPGGTLAAGQTVSFLIDFVNPGRIGINYNLQVVAPVP